MTSDSSDRRVLLQLNPDKTEVLIIAPDNLVPEIMQHLYSHVTPLLHSMHWLPVTYRIQFKILTITYRALH